ncbi:hypothetical protein BOTBODRAFT_601648 [Botryobasidium botryosum FD-172 SS1]|uniref:Uncharacterized protein n=1 Tax=Botryobasidium botryosum (strain FD-172 SS1) TaxID=930990 RepID=A0A067MNC0_BOTB1|nr:hypothetical protein BOTBODRAFT_601648 [Botryobasidium botryosum FD-172 SS1]
MIGCDAVVAHFIFFSFSLFLGCGFGFSVRILASALRPRHSFEHYFTNVTSSTCLARTIGARRRYVVWIVLDSLALSHRKPLLSFFIDGSSNILPQDGGSPVLLCRDAQLRPQLLRIKKLFTRVHWDWRRPLV